MNDFLFERDMEDMTENFNSVFNSELTSDQHDELLMTIRLFRGKILYKKYGKYW